MATYSAINVVAGFNARTSRFFEVNFESQSLDRHIDLVKLTHHEHLAYLTHLTHLTHLARLAGLAYIAHLAYMAHLVIWNWRIWNTSHLLHPAFDFPMAHMASETRYTYHELPHLKHLALQRK
jgi:hypothetical protein